MSKQIQVHEFQNQEAATHWIQSMGSSVIIIPMQPLFIDGVPNILPLQYFFPKDPKENYPVFQVLVESLITHAPSSLSQKSIRSIANDCFKQESMMAHAYEWIHAAMQAFNQHPVVINANKQRQQAIKYAGEWVNHQHKDLIIFGLNNEQMNTMMAFLDHIHISIHWAIPSLIKKDHQLNILDMPDWVHAWAKEKKQQRSSITVNGFDSIEEECHQVIQHAKKLTEKVALVVPNDHIKKWLMIESKKQGVDIRTSTVRLKDTQLGALLTALINWISSPTMDEFNRLIHAWDWPEMTDVKERIKLLLAMVPYNKHIKRVPTIVEESEQAKWLWGISSIADIHALFEGFNGEFGLEDDAYFQYQCLSLIQGILTDAQSLNPPVAYVAYMLEHQIIDAKTVEDPGIICIEPESLGKVPSHAVWVMGVGNETWKSTHVPNYLTTDAPSSEFEGMAIREAYAGWCLSHPQLMGASYAVKVNDRDNHALDSIRCKTVRIKKEPIKEVPYKRMAISTGGVSSIPISPSSLALYQRCPYAFYIKNHLNISANHPVSEYQVLGFLIHNIVEKLAIKELKNMTEIQHYLNQEFNPLMAKVMENTILSDWPMDDVLSLFSQHDGSIETEKEMSCVYRGVQLKGRADVILKSDATIEVMDVKSGKVPTKKDIQGYDYIQLGVYGIMLKMAHPNTPIKASLLSKGPKYQAPIDMGNDEYEEYERGLLNYLDQLLDGLNQAKFSIDDAMGSDKEKAKQCRVCDYYHACHKKERHQR